MPFNGSGTFAREGGTTAWVDDRNAAIKIRADLHDTHDQDIAAGLTACICKNGESTTSARIPFAFGISVADGTAAAPSYNFTADGDIGMYRIASDNLGLAVNGVKALDITASNFSVTSKVTLTAGQLAFPATQNASADANTLDDYEEGAWTPALAGSSTAGTQTYSVQLGRYNKIGKLVTVWWRISLSAKDAATSGNMRITGLPFTAGAVNAPAALAETNLWDLDVAGGFYKVAAYAVNGTTRIDLFEVGDNVADAALTQADFAATSRINGTCTYEATG
jgi:hypothetical protein